MLDCLVMKNCVATLKGLDVRDLRLKSAGRCAQNSSKAWMTPYERNPERVKLSPARQHRAVTAASRNLKDLEPEVSALIAQLTAEAKRGRSAPYPGPRRQHQAKPRLSAARTILEKQGPKPKVRAPPETCHGAAEAGRSAHGLMPAMWCPVASDPARTMGNQNQQNPALIPRNRCAPSLAGMKTSQAWRNLTRAR